MTTVTPNVEQETRRAWAQYADRLRGLDGGEYDAAEQDAWDELQTALQALGAPVAPLHHPPVG